MTFANPLPTWALVLVIVAAAAVAWIAYRGAALPRHKRVALALIRFVTLCVLIVSLMRPVARITMDERHAAVVPILVDTSRSMGIEDAGGRSRLDAARQLLVERLLPAIEPRFKVEVLAVGEEVHPASAADLSPIGRRSDLAGAISAARARFAGTPVAGIVLLSDGGDTSGLALSTDLGSPAPVFPIAVGSLAVRGDREVLGATVADVVLDESRVDVAVTAVAHGHGADPIELRLLQDGRPVEVRRATPSADGAPVHEVFQVSPAPGATTIYTIEIPHATGEPVPENNARSVLVQPPARPRRVLLVEGAPGFEHSFIKRAWAADRGLDVDAVVRKGTNDQGAGTFYIQAGQRAGGTLASGFPASEEALFAYDALVLANVAGEDLSPGQADMVRAFVATRGGGLLVFGARALVKPGLTDTALEEVLPVQLAKRGDAVPASAAETNRVALTEAGRIHPIMQFGRADDILEKWRALPPLAFVAPLGGPRVGATVLAHAGGAGASRVLAAVQRFGAGRAMLFSGEASWRWKMMLPASDRSFETFWRQAVRWLALPAPDAVSISTPPDVAPGDSLPIRVLARNATFEPQRDASVQVTVTAPDGSATRVPAAPSEEPGEFVARVQVNQAGVHRVAVTATIGNTSLGSPTTSVLVGGADLEMADPRVNQQVLRRIAEASGGQLVTPDDASTLVQRLLVQVQSASSTLQRDVWHTGWWFAAIITLLATEWTLRRRWGLR